MKKFLWIILIIPVLFGAGFVLWAEIIPAPMPEAIAALQTIDSVIVQSDYWLVFSPAGSQPETGLILYPGGRVDYRAYAPAARAVAARGFLVVIPPMPLNLAVFSPGRAAEVIATYPAIRHWAVGGHSLGGSMAANYAYNNSAVIQGLALWASYPASSNDLSRLPLAVVSISGSLDGLATPEQINASRFLLPQDTVWVAIEGGNHAQFGWYGAQPGDNPAVISRTSQQDQVISATVDLLIAIGK